MRHTTQPSHLSGGGRQKMAGRPRGETTALEARDRQEIVGHSAQWGICKWSEAGLEARGCLSHERSLHSLDLKGKLDSRILVTLDQVQGCLWPSVRRDFHTITSVVCNSFTDIQCTYTYHLHTISQSVDSIFFASLFNCFHISLRMLSFFPRQLLYLSSISPTCSPTYHAELQGISYLFSASVDFPTLDRPRNWDHIICAPLWLSLCCRLY